MPVYSSAIGEFVIGYSPIGGAVIPNPSGLPFSTPWPGALKVLTGPYLYEEYNDDQDLQAFVDGYNELEQQYLNWFNLVVLADYTNKYVVGPLLDWIGTNLYGIERPTLPAGPNQVIGPLNTWALNTIPFNAEMTIIDQTFYVVTDDIYKRIIAWHFFKADGKAFSIPWLKRRIMRFLVGINGTCPNIDQTNDIGVAWSGTACTITIHNSASYLVAVIFQAAVQAQVLELPFQFTYTVNLA